MKPTRSILDPDFQWVPSHNTDLRTTFQRIRERKAAEAEAIRQRKAEYERKRDEHLREQLASCATADPPPKLRTVK